MKLEIIHLENCNDNTIINIIGFSVTKFYKWVVLKWATLVN